MSNPKSAAQTQVPCNADRCAHLIVDVAICEHGVEVLHALACTPIVGILQPLLDGAHVHGALDYLMIILQDNNRRLWLETGASCTSSQQGTSHIHFCPTMKIYIMIFILYCMIILFFYKEQLVYTPYTEI